MANSEQVSTQETFGIAGAASRLESLLGDDGTIPETPMKPTREDEPAAEAKAPEKEEPKSEAETKPDAEAEEAPAEEAAAEEPAEDANEETEQQPSTEPHYTVKVDGKEEKVPLSELLQGYSRTSDYTRKTQAVAQERKQLQEHTEKLNAERAQYAQLLPALQQQLTTGVNEPNWEKLYAENPQEFAAQKALWDLHQQKVQAVAQENTRVQQALAAETQRIRNEKAVDGRKKLIEEFPEWKNPEKFEADRVKLVDRLYQRHNLNDQEVSVITLYPTVLADMQKARMWDEYQAKRANPVPVKSSEKAPPTLSAGSSANSPKQTSELTRAKQRLAQTGHVQDAAAIFESLI